MESKRAFFFGAGGFSLSMLALLLFFYSPYLFFNRDFCTGDLAYYFEPQCSLIRESMVSGHLPLWNMFSHCGDSIIANPQPSIFFPANFLFAILDFSQALALLLLIHQLIAGLGIFLIVKRLGWCQLSQWLAGISYAFCGYLFSIQTQYSLQTTCALAPFFLWTVMRIRDGSSMKRCGDLILLVSAFFLVVSSGRFEVYVPLFLFTGFIMLLQFYRACKLNEKNFGTKRFLYQLGGCLFGFLFSAFLLLPEFEWVLLSPRAAGLGADEVFRWSANWYDFFSIICPQALGDLSQLHAPFLGLVSTSENHRAYLQSPLLGAIVILLSSWGFCDKTWKERWIPLSCAIIATVMALGKYTPIGPLLLNIIPGLSLMRYPVKFLIFLDLSLVIAAARGAELMVSRKLSSSTIVSSASTCVLLAILAAVTMQEPFIFPEADPELGLAAQHAILWSLIQSAVTALGFCTLVLLFLRDRIPGRLLSAGTLVFVAFALLAPAFIHLRPSAPAGFFSKDIYLKNVLDKLDQELAEKQEHNKPSTDNSSEPGTDKSSMQSTDKGSRQRRNGEYRLLRGFSDAMATKSYVDKLASAGIDDTAAVVQYNRQVLMPNVNMDCKFFSAFGYDMTVTGDHYKLAMGVMKSSKDSRRKGSSPSDPHDVPLHRFCRMSSTKYLVNQLAILNSDGLVKGAMPLLDSQLFQPIAQDPGMNLLIYRVLDSVPRAYFAKHWAWCEDDFMDKLLHSQDPTIDPIDTVRLSKPKETTVPPTLQEGSAIANEASVLQELEFSADEPEHVQIQIRRSNPGLLVLQDTYYPGWEAYVDGAETTLYKANLIGRAVACPAGRHTVDFYFRPKILTIGFYLSLLAIFSSAAILGIALWRKKPENNQIQ